MREVVRSAFGSIAARFSDDAPTVDERALRRRYGATSAWPVDAELGLVLLAWTFGSGFSAPSFRDALVGLRPDFERAARVLRVRDSALPPLITIAEIARCSLRNGAIVVRWNLPAEVLYWPTALSSCAGATTT